jgi:hypothetical protein
VARYALKEEAGRSTASGDYIDICPCASRENDSDAHLDCRIAQHYQHKLSVILKVISHRAYCKEDKPSEDHLLVQP